MTVEQIELASETKAREIYEHIRANVPEIRRARQMLRERLTTLTGGAR